MTALRCTGCDLQIAADAPWPFRCPHAGDGRDHVLARDAAPAWQVAAGPIAGDPFVRYRALAYPWQVARARGLTDDAYVALVAQLDRAVAAVDGHGFAITPYRRLDDDRLWAKDETDNVAGSHKARHLFGLALWLEVAARTGLVTDDDRARPLAIASCGNAALAAAVVARALERRLRVFVPPSADPAVVARLTALGAELEACPRRPDDPPGDPCYHRFRAAVAAGALPFTCQGSDNGLTIDGGVTLGLELAEQDAARGAGPLDRVVVQVGGGALASAVAQGLRWAHDRGVIAHVPAVHAVQTAGCFPLVRAWRRVARALAIALSAPVAPAADDATDADGAHADAAVARWLTAHAPPTAIAAAITTAAVDRALFMWPWEQEPRSVASGILDDETYDWLAIVRAMLTTGGWPVVVTEAELLAARARAAAAGIRASATGAAGLAGVATITEAAGPRGADARVAVLLTGVER
ncbi:MAG: PLP-dependent lyase/thiolase [Myxococcales bacterium]|nr:PLP-dependent lyase/thiolase [Myxococcales bacterium]